MALEIPGYENLTEIGRGGFAVVYRGWSSSFGREVAIKVLALPGSSDDDRRRFERERRIVGSLSWHPHIVTVYDSGTTSADQPYLVYEYLPGGSLGARLKALGPMASAEAATAGVQICDALEAAHRSGVLHRDVKPDNVMVDRFGELQLTDFGVAQMAHGTNTSTGTLVGTVSYMAPEIINGSPASPASDIYATGSTLFTLLAGRGAFLRSSDATPLASVMRATQEPVPDLRAYRVDDQLASIIERSMAKEPAQRFASAADLAEALQGVQHALGIAPTPVRFDRVQPAFQASTSPDDESTVLRTPGGGAPPIDDPTMARGHQVPLIGAVPATFDGDPASDETRRRHAIGAPTAEPDVPPRRKHRLLIGAVVVLVLLLGGTVAGLLMTSHKATSAPATTTTSAPTTTAGPTTTNTTTKPTTTTAAPTTTAPPTTPPTTAYHPPTTRYSPPTTHYSPPTTHYSPPATTAPPPACTVVNGVGVCH